MSFEVTLGHYVLIVDVTGNGQKVCEVTRQCSPGRLLVIRFRYQSEHIPVLVRMQCLDSYGFGNKVEGLQDPVYSVPTYEVTRNPRQSMLIGTTVRRYPFASVYAQVYFCLEERFVSCYITN